MRRNTSRSPIPTSRASSSSGSTSSSKGSSGDSTSPSPFVTAGRPSGSVRDANELEALVPAGDHPLLDLTDPRGVVLLFELRLDRAPLDRPERSSVRPGRHLHQRDGPQHACLVEPAAGRVVLLPIDVARLGVPFHDDPRLAAVDRGSPGVARPHEPAVLQLQRVLAHVPDAAVLVLCVPVEGALHGPPPLGDRVANDRAPDSEDLLRLSGPA